MKLYQLQKGCPLYFAFQKEVNDVVKNSVEVLVKKGQVARHMVDEFEKYLKKIFAHRMCISLQIDHN